ncbi:MAG: Ig-like domain-containing protein [Myxococcota bacterium]
MRSHWIAALAATAVCACEAKIASVEVSPPKLELSSEKTKDALTFAPKDANGKRIEGKRATWTSADPKVATVDAQGKVSAIGSGSTVVTAKVEEISGTAQVVVVMVKGLKLDAEKLDIVVDAEPKKLSVSFVNEREEPVQASRPVVWTVKDPAVATVSQGAITGVAPGTTIVEAAAGELKATAEITVTAPEAPAPTP